MEYNTDDDSYQTVGALEKVSISPLWAEHPSQGASLLSQRYEVKGLLGAGGAGSVFRARDLVLGEDVALKVLKRLHPHPSDAIEDLRNEVRLARRVTHRSIARVYDLVEHNGVYFLTMEFIDGLSLAKRLGRGRSKQTILPLHEVVTHSSQIAEGLYAAHSADVFHCDLKPENVMLSRTGRTVIMDFGIARTRESQRAGGAASGTPAYISPEQLASRAIDGRSDLFSLGVMMFEMLTGKLPFSGDTAMAMALARQLYDAPLLSTLRPDLPSEITQLVARCLCRLSEERFATAEELRRALLSVPLTVDAQSFATSRKLQRDPDETIFFSAESRLRAVAVWRLQNLGAPDDAYLSRGLADSLLDALSGIRDVRVIPRTALKRQVTQSAEPLAAAKELGAHAFVSGSYSRHEATLQVTLRLLAVDSGFQLWIRRWEIPFGQALSMCQQAAQAIAVALTSEVTTPQSEDILDPDTLSLYLKARLLYTGNDPAFFRHSVELLEQALARQPNSPLLLVGYAKACARAWFWGHSDDQDKAMNAARRAVEVAPNQAPPYLALGAACYGAGDLPGSVRALRTGLRILPQFADCYELLGRIICECGPLSDAVALLESAQRLDPLAARPRLEMVRMFALTGAWMQVDALLGQEITDPRAAPLWWMVTGRMAVWRKDPAWAKKRLDLPGDESAGCRLGKRMLRLVASEDGSGALSDDELQTLFGADERANPRRRIVIHQTRVELSCFEQKPAAALRALADCVDDGLSDMLWMDLCPLLEVVRSEARFLSFRQIVVSRAKQIRDAMDQPLP